MSSLPPDWQEVTDSTGRTYYYNVHSRKTSWTPPQASDIEKQETATTETTLSPLPEGWKEADSDGKKYYFNIYTQETTWERPAAPAVNPAASVSVSSIPAPWQQASTPEGKVYYYNQVTRETSWVLPNASTANPPAFTAKTSSQNAYTTVSPRFSSPSSFFKPSAISSTPGLPKVEEGVSLSSSPTDTVSGKGRTYAKELSGSMQIRGTGMFKSWNGCYVVVKSRSTLTIYENEQQKKVRATVPLDHVLAVPLNRGDDKTLLVMYEFDKNLCVSPDVDVSLAVKEHLLDTRSIEMRDQLLEVVMDQGAEVRKALWEGSVCVNGSKEKHAVVYNTHVQLFKKITDETPESVVTISEHTLLQTEPSQHPLLYDANTYGAVTPHTLLISDRGDEGAHLYYIRVVLSGLFPSLADALKEAVAKKSRKVDPSSIMEGYLYKSNSNHTRWARRFCILRNDKLSYFKERGSDKAAGEVFLPAGFEVELLNNVDAAHPHKICIAESGDEGTRQFQICALNTDEYQKWSAAFVQLQQKKANRKDAKSTREGYGYIIAKGKKPQKRFIVLTNSRMSMYGARHDIHEIMAVNLDSSMGVTQRPMPGEEGAVNGHRLHVVCLSTGASSIGDMYLGFTSEQDCLDWQTAYKPLVGNLEDSTHPDVIREGFLYKAKSKGALGNLKYYMLTADRLYYALHKTNNLSECKPMDLCGDIAVVPLDDSVLAGQGYYGFAVSNSGDEGAKTLHLFVDSVDERDTWVNTINESLSKKDWRRDDKSVKEGYLYKSSTNGKNWTRRYFIMYESNILYYKKKMDPEPTGEILLPGGFVVDKVNPSSSEDKAAVENAAAFLKIKPTEVNGLYIAPTGDSDARRYWLALNTELELSLWLEVLSSLSASKSANLFPQSIKEGYLNVNGKQSSQRRYVVLHKDKVTWYKRKLDPECEDIMNLPPGFDVYMKEEDEATHQGFFYVAPNPSESLTDYKSFCCSTPTEQREWLSAFRQLQTQCTNRPCYPVIHQGYLYVEKAPYSSPQTNTGSLLPKKLRFVVVQGSRLLVYRLRGDCYVNEAPPSSLRASLSAGLMNCNMDSYVDLTDFNVEQLLATNQLKLIADHNDSALKFSIHIGNFLYTFTTRSYSEKNNWCSVFFRLFNKDPEHRASLCNTLSIDKTSSNRFVEMTNSPSALKAGAHFVAPVLPPVRFIAGLQPTPFSAALQLSSPSSHNESSIVLNDAPKSYLSVEPDSPSEVKVAMIASPSLTPSHLPPAPEAPKPSGLPALPPSTSVPPPPIQQQTSAPPLPLQSSQPSTPSYNDNVPSDFVFSAPPPAALPQPKGPPALPPTLPSSAPILATPSKPKTEEIMDFDSPPPPAPRASVCVSAVSRPSISSLPILTSARDRVSVKVIQPAPAPLVPLPMDMSDDEDEYNMPPPPPEDMSDDDEEPEAVMPPPPAPADVGMGLVFDLPPPMDMEMCLPPPPPDADEEPVAAKTKAPPLPMAPVPRFRDDSCPPPPGAFK